MIRIVIAEDHQVIIDGLKLSFEYENDIELVGQANDGEALIDMARLKRPEIILTDIRMPKCDGITATRKIKNLFPEIKIIAFSMFDQPQAILQMREAGAVGYLSKNSSLAKVTEAIREVAKGNLYFETEISAKNNHTQQTILLSHREKEILRLIGEGKTSTEIADLLFIAKSTVDTHRKNIIKKINLHGKTDLLRFAVERKYDF